MAKELYIEISNLKILFSIVKGSPISLILELLAHFALIIAVIPVELQDTWLLKFFVDKITHTQLTISQLVLLLMNSCSEKDP